MPSPRKLTTNGLIPADDFPAASYETVHTVVVRARSNDPLYHHYAGAWNALAYRYSEMADRGDEFTSLLDRFGSTPEPSQRYEQERAVFDFFSSAFSVLEATFYALYTFGAFLGQASFNLSTERDQQRVTPTRTKEAVAAAFPTDPIVGALDKLFADPRYQRLREIRNVLTHRAAPGRKIFVSLGDEGEPAVEWKLNNIPFDSSLVANSRRDLSELLADLLAAISDFVRRRLQ